MTQAFDFFTQTALPSPDISAAQAGRFVQERYGIEGVVTELGSQQDANFLIEAPAGKYVLKVSNPAFTVEDLAAQDAAAAHVAHCEPGIRVPVGLAGRDGLPIQQLTLGSETTAARLVTFVEGNILSAHRYLAPSVVGSLGELAGRTTRALASFDGVVPARALQWDLRNAPEVVARLADFVAVPGGAEAARSAAAAASQALASVRDSLPTQVIHGDLTDDNVVAVLGVDGRPRPIGVIDFGDLMESWAIAELAVTCSSLLQYGDLTTILPAIQAFDRVRRDLRRRTGRAVAARRTAGCRADGERAAAGAHRSGQRVRGQESRPRVAHLRASDLGAAGRDDGARPALRAISQRTAGRSGTSVAATAIPSRCDSTCRRPARSCTAVRSWTSERSPLVAAKILAGAERPSPTCRSCSPG